jgi:hypothetical protein
MLVMPVMLLLLSDTISQQRTPDFSGTWTLAEFRIGDEPAAGSSPIIGGAAVNCGVACTITQTLDTLTVSRAPAKDGAKPRDEVVHLDGRPMSGNTTAKWDGTKLVLVRSFLEIVVTQTLSLEKERLMVVVAVATAKTGPYTLTYERK